MANSANNMKTAFILAAGTGSRMMPLTKDTPKPLLKINNRPMISYVLDLLKFHGFSNIGINVSYLGEKIHNYLKHENINFIYEKSPTGTAGGILALCRKVKPDSPFLVISSDMMVNFDLTKIYNFHFKQKAIATVCCYFRPKSKISSKKSGQVMFNKKTKIISEIIERSEKITSQWVNSSVYIFDPEVLDVLKDFQKNEIDVAKDLLPKLLSLHKNVFAYPVNSGEFYQLGIDSPERIVMAEDDIVSGKFIPSIP